MNISNSMTAFNVRSIDGLRSEQIYVWPRYGQTTIERTNPIESDFIQNSIQVSLPREERDELIRSYIENKNDSLYTPNGKNYAASFAIVGTLFDALV